MQQIRNGVSPMEKINFLKILPAILGFAAFAVPALGFEKDGIALWMFGAVAEDGVFSKYNLFMGETFEKNPQLILLLVSGIVIVVGAVLSMLSALNVVKLGKLGWLPGVVMLAGASLYFIGCIDTEMFLIAPVVLNVACGALGGVWALVDGIKATRPA
jgi:hypothetical protein